MKKFFSLIITLAVLSFSACSTNVVTPKADSGLEGREISTYLIGKYITPKDAQMKLEAAGFEVVANYKSVKKVNYYK